ncbi:polyamine-modulated factor 1 [Ictalurus furcatus]|uniref:polyamine-modulated factor 1 n=1 Tax=Ictalurus furcatus TaxID=66913 RepID=UPI00234FE574|nr:polyamine-modulated factor 1 [Ictalurus furcatus]
MVYSWRVDENVNIGRGKMEDVANCRSNENSSRDSGQTSENASSIVSVQTGVTENVPVKCEPRRSRLKVFNKVMEKSLQRLIADASFNRFAHSFHPLCKQNPQMAEVIHKQFISDLQKAIQEDINKVIEEGDLQVKLEELDRLEEQAKDTPGPTWRPSGVPEQDVCSVLIPYHRGQEEYVRRELRKLQKENAALAQRVQSGRDTITHTEQRISAAVDEWKASVADLESFVSSLCPSENFESL